MDFYSQFIKIEHIYLLLAYSQKRNKSQAQKAIYDSLEIDLSLGRKVIPLTQELVEWGLIERINPNSSNSSGHVHETNFKGRVEIEKYIKKLRSISLERRYI